MRKTNKNLTKQILTLMLAFIMVFTGIGIGSWGVDEAWADTQITVDGAALERIEGSKYGDDVDVFFAKVDNNSTSISLSIDSIYYIRVESSFYNKPTYASESIYSQTDWYNSADAYVAYSENGSTNVEEFLEGSGFDTVEDWVKDGGYENLNEYLGGTVQEAWSSCGYVIVPYSNGAYTITLPNTNASINGNTFSQYFGNSSQDYDSTAKRYYLFELCQDINGILGRTADCKAVVLVQVGGKKAEVDVNAFKNMIIMASGNMKDTYYDLDDHWNGKTYNANGF